MKPDSRDPSSVVPAAWEEVLAGNPFVVEEGNIGPGVEHHIGLEEGIDPDPEGDRSRPVEAAGGSSWTCWMMVS